MQVLTSTSFAEVSKVKDHELCQDFYQRYLNKPYKPLKSSLKIVIHTTVKLQIAQTQYYVVSSHRLTRGPNRHFTAVGDSKIDE